MLSIKQKNYITFPSPIDFKFTFQTII